MKLQIDRYRLLGVGVGAESNSILNQLERRLEKCEYSGFGAETLKRRKEILKENCDTLLDPAQRSAYEEEYITHKEMDRWKEPEIEVRSGYEIAAALLLLEAGDKQESLSAAKRIYKEQRMNMSYFSSEYKELNRIMDYASIGLAQELRDKRHYESAACILEQRIKDQSIGMGEKEMITEMNYQLRELMPFRILDILSRDDDEKIHKKGVQLLKGMINDRGGLDTSSNIYMEDSEFQAFFRQIRKYLTVQEQIELYNSLGDEGSRSGKFLQCIALVAQGFTQRKPDRIYESIRKIQDIRSPELEPIIANMHLLLGDIETANSLFEMYGDENLKEWSTSQSSDKLGALCEWCREWLKRDVLRGYRDIESEADIEAYFSDRDVIRYIEDRDMERIIGENTITVAQQTQNRSVGMDTLEKRTRENQGDVNVKRANKRREILIRGVSEITGSMNGKSIIRHIRENVFIFGVIAVTSTSLIVFTGTSKNKNDGDTHRKTRVSNTQPLKAVDKPVGLLETIKMRLEDWHKVKTKALSENKMPETAENIATSRLLRQLEQDLKENIRNKQRQETKVRIREIRITKENANEVQITAKLDYADEIRSLDGRLIDKRKEHTFDRPYNFKWNGERWLVDK